MAEQGLTPAAATPQPPQALQLARVLWIASTVVSLVRSMTKLADRETIMNQIQAMQPGLSFDQVDSAATASILMALVLSLGVVGLFAWLAGRMLAGIGWARTVLTVIGAISVVIGVIGMGGLLAGTAQAAGLRFTTLDVLFGLVILALDTAALVMMFRRESVSYFTTMTTMFGPSRRR